LNGSFTKGGYVDATTKWVKRLTGVAALCTVVTVIMFGALLLAMVAFAPVINPFPALLSAGVGFMMSLTGLWMALRAPQQRIAIVLNIAFIMVLGGIVVLILLLAFQPWRTTIRETVILPPNFMGTVSIVYGVATGEPLEHNEAGTITYRIPPDGLLLIRDAAPQHTSYRRQYVFVQPDGSFTPITAHWYSTIHETDADFLSPTVGSYLETGGEFSPGGGQCKFQHQHFVIGTKQYIRSGQRVVEPAMLRRANLKC